ncbi:MAG: UDP-N-acetylmuramoyl-tripeptide--D-alanyl-D-alanine ligase [Planctomycetota bacterium]|nr:UDP-N-acetylmuramoyl-tripeptide--D-alanyl-D-alanine ligase [Planctomycetota bacterium]
MLGLTPVQVSDLLNASLHGSGNSERLNAQLGASKADSRLVQKGDLFVALPGAHSDGHDWLHAAYENGAAAALVSRVTEDSPSNLPLILVEDSLLALHELARHQLKSLGAPVVGITGSVGKTTAKDMLAHLLGGPSSQVHAAPASYNSEIGLPLAILAAPLGTKRMVLEFGVNEPGEMEALLSIALPEHAWITALSPAHMEGMKSFDTLVHEKSFLAHQGAQAGGVWSTSRVCGLAAARGEIWSASPHLAGFRRGGAEVLNPVPGAFEVELPQLGVCKLPVMAYHEAELVAVAVDLALSLGESPKDLKQRLSDLPRPPGRLQKKELAPWTLLDDAYNSSPTAAFAALEVVSSWPGVPFKAAVMGTMHELGDLAPVYHRAVGTEAAHGDLDLLIGVGQGGEWILEGARSIDSAMKTEFVENAAAAFEKLQAHCPEGSLILLKASRAEALEEVFS